MGGAQKPWDPTKPYVCSNNLSIPGASFYHPEFIFWHPTKSVRLQLKAMHEGPKGEGTVLWDVVFAGRPGNDYSIPNWAPVSGGLKPLFPEFCLPQNEHAMYELR